MPDAADQPELGAKADRFLVQSEGTAEDLPAGERITVPFEGQGSGVEALSWGQLGLWDAMQRQRSWFPIGSVVSLPAGTQVAEAVADLRFAMARYQTLRTRLRFDADGVKQVLSPAGEVTLEIVDAPEGADPAQVAAGVMRRYEEADYDFVGQWPIRMAVIRHRGALTHRVIVMCHLVTDGTGASIMASELAARVGGAGIPPVTGMEPILQARWQQSPAGQRQSGLALRYCERVLRTVSARRFPEPTDKPQPRYWYASFSSPALYLAARALAARTQRDTATVLLAVFAIAKVRVTGIDPMMAMLLVSNRFRPGLADPVSPVTNAVPCAIDVTGATLDEVVVRASGRTMAAYKNGYFDPLQFNALVGRISRERGEEVDTACYLNDRRIQHRQLPDRPPPTRKEVRAALPRTSFEWKLKQDKEAYERFFLHIEDVPDTVTISVVIDTHEVSPDHTEACLRGMEEVAVAAVTDPAYIAVPG